MPSAEPMANDEILPCVIVCLLFENNRTTEKDIRRLVDGGSGDNFIDKSHRICIRICDSPDIHTPIPGARRPAVPSVVAPMKANLKTQRSASGASSTNALERQVRPRPAKAGATQARGRKAKATRAVRSAYRTDRDPHALRLIKARLAAGYRSGHTAADLLGWVVSTYAFDEAGRRTMSPERIPLYAAAFRVPAAWLADEIPDADRSEDAARARMLDAMSVPDIRITYAVEGGGCPPAAGAAERLAKARRDAGFRTVRAAAAHFGWVGSTTYAHENGSAPYGIEAARRYGLAYGADPGWLVTGVVPPCPPDRTPAEWPTGGPRGTREAIDALISEQRLSRRRKALPASAIEPPAAPHRGLQPVVKFAKEVPPGSRFREGDRLVVDRRGSGEGFYAAPVGRGGVRVFFLRAGDERPTPTLGRIESIVVDRKWRIA